MHIVKYMFFNLSFKMEIVDKDFKNGFICAFQFALIIYMYRSWKHARLIHSVHLVCVDPRNFWLNLKRNI